MVYSSGEPSLFIDKSAGTLWVSAIAPTQLYSSTDGGNTFFSVPLPYGKWNQSGSDADVITDSSGRVHAIDQIGTQCAFYMRSTNGGKTFATMTDFGNGTWASGTSSSCTGQFSGAVDRPWLASYGSILLLVYNTNSPNSPGQAIDISTDGGLSFVHKIAVPVSECSCTGSSTALAVDPNDGTLYLPYITWSKPTSLKVAVSTNGGSSFQYHTIAQRSNLSPAAISQGGFPVISVDRGGNVHAVWSDNSTGSYNVYLSTSKDRGSTWSAPFMVDSQNGQHFKPWVVAGNAGSVAVAWWGTTDSVPAPWNAVNAKWYVHLSISTDALDQNPVFQESTVGSGPFHAGSICSHTYTCADTNNSNGEHDLGDFFQIAADRSGWVDVVWPDTAQYNGSTSHIFFSKELSGPNLFGTSTTTTSTSATSSSTTTTASTATVTPTAVTTSNTVASTAPTSTTSSTASSTASTSSTSTSSSSGSSTTPPPINSTISTNSTRTSTSSSSGGGIPEFPSQILLAVVFTILIVVSYLFSRRQSEACTTDPKGALTPSNTLRNTSATELVLPFWSSRICL